MAIRADGFRDHPPGDSVEERLDVVTSSETSQAQRRLLGRRAQDGLRERLQVGIGHGDR